MILSFFRTIRPRRFLVDLGYLLSLVSEAGLFIWMLAEIVIRVFLLKRYVLKL